MRSRKELIQLNIKDLTQEEIESLSDHELNCCDNCGEIEQSEKLNWLEGEDFLEDAVCVDLYNGGIIAICDSCYDKKGKFAQCGHCKRHFIAHKENNNKCPHCQSMNWIFGYINKSEKVV